MPSETKIAEKKRRLLEQLNQVAELERQAKKKRLAKEARERNRLNQDLGWAVLNALNVDSLKKLRGQIGHAKTDLVREVKKRSGTVVVDESTFNNVMGYLAKIISEREAASSE
jgi:hypothetical protein